MKAISLPSTPPALTPAVNGINVDFGKNPRCANFGVPATIVRYRRTEGNALSITPGTAYRLSCCGQESSSNSVPAMSRELVYQKQLGRHKRIGPIRPLFASTFERMLQHIWMYKQFRACGDKTAYYRFGKTAAGTPGYRCRLCGKTVTAGGKALKKQRTTRQNKTILLSLTKKMPIRPIAKVTGINVSTLYGRIGFLHRQCLAFAADRGRTMQTLKSTESFAM